MRDREEKDENNGRGLFYGVIGVATLIVAIIGATFAWFTATAPGDNVTVQSGTLTITYTNGTQVHADNLKPATTEQILQYKDTCIITGEEEQTGPPVVAAEQICAVYTFTVENTGTLRAVMSGTVTNITNTYPTGVIKYVLVQSTTVIESDLEAANTFAGTFTMPSNVSLAPGATESYTLLIWLDENAVNSGPNDASNKTLSGILNITANQTNFVEPAPIP